jgi:hypothetical protein
MNAMRPTSDGSTTRRTTFAADLTAAVYLIALQHGTGESWVDLHLSLWKAVNATIDKWVPETSPTSAPPREQPESS